MLGQYTGIENVELTNPTMKAFAKGKNIFHFNTRIRGNWIQYIRGKHRKKDAEFQFAERLSEYKWSVLVAYRSLGSPGA